MKKESNVYKITKLVVDIIFILGFAALALVPFLMDYYAKLLNYSSSLQITLTVIVVILGIVTLFIVYNLKKILKNVLKNNPFTKDSINCLRKMALGCLVIALVLCIKLIIKFTIPSLVLVIALSIATLCFLTLKDLFKQAMFYKEETDGMV